MTMSGSSTVTLNWSNNGQHNVSKFYFSRHTDTDGSLVDSGYTANKSTTSKSYSVGDNHRYCAKANGFSDAGFQGLNAFSPNTFYGCWTRKTGNAGRLMATSHRAYGSVIKVKNLSGGPRDIIVTGPGLQNIGCSWQSIAYNGTYSCTASVGIRQYSDLLVVMQTSGGAQTLAALDFD